MRRILGYDKSMEKNREEEIIEETAAAVAKADMDAAEAGAGGANACETDTDGHEKAHCKYAIGLRTIKTVLAVFICLLLHFVFKTETGLYSCIAAVVCMRETPGESWQMGLHRFYGTLIGGAMGFLLMELAERLPAYTDWMYVLLIPAGLIGCIWLCLMIDKKNGVIICCVVFISIGLDFTMDAGWTLQLVILRIVDTTVGIVVAGLLNRYFFPREV